jgi:Uma2 family endonuclease
MSAHAIPFLTPEQYLDVERKAEFKSEYYAGRMFAMAGGTLAHALIPMNIAAQVREALGKRNCRAVNSDLRVRISESGPFVYPDLSIYCGEPKLADGHKDTLLNPQVVFEVLSPSSEAHDRGHKFSQYRKIPSLQEYVLVSQTEPRIEVFLRQPEGKWILTEYVGLDAICSLASVGCSVSLSAVYDGVDLESASA